MATTRMSISTLLNAAERSAATQDGAAASPPAMKPRNSSMHYTSAIFYDSSRLLDHPDETPASINYKYINRVYYSPVGDLFMHVDGTTGCLNSFVAQRQLYPKVKILLSIGGEATHDRTLRGYHLPKVASKPESRRTFAASAKDLVLAHDLDGVDLHWDFPNTMPEGEHYIQLLAALREEFDPARYLLTATVPSDEEEIRRVNFTKAGIYVDEFNLKCYDFYGSWSKICGHHSQLKGHISHPCPTEERSCDTVVRWMRSAGAHPGKIVFGIPAYGWTFPGAAYAGQLNCTEFNGKMIDYKEIADMPLDDTERERVQFDPEALAICRVGGHGLLSYDSPATVQLKAEYVRKNRLGGLFYTTGLQDHPNPEKSLIYHGYKGLKDYPGQYLREHPERGQQGCTTTSFTKT